VHEVSIAVDTAMIAKNRYFFIMLQNFAAKVTKNKASANFIQRTPCFVQQITDEVPLRLMAFMLIASV
jgi:hypothetical protein